MARTMENGTVTAVNAKWQRFVAKDGAGKFSAFVLDAPGKVKRGDAVAWERMPGQTHFVVDNRSSNQPLRVTALALAVSRAHAEAFLKGND